MPLSETQLRFIELEKKKAEVKQFFDDLKTATEALVGEIGIGTFFQDDEGVVYKTTVPEGKFVFFEKYAVLRTRREGEAKGDLSMSSAREAGFVVEGK